MCNFFEYTENGAYEETIQLEFPNTQNSFTWVWFLSLLESISLSVKQRGRVTILFELENIGNLLLLIVHLKRL